ncbi:MAG: YheC/YheD family protein [Oscillospiraceae bacterium]|nr:YheC/YheD family protein [Oscillospiraceae bacterium]
MLIGYMHYRKNPLGLNKAYAFAAAAKAEGAELLYFSPGAVNKSTINGYIYRNGEWVNTVSRYPDVICNVAGFTNDKQLEIIEKLEKEVPFTSYSIGSKLTVFENLKKYKVFSEYLLPSEKVVSAKHFFTLSDKYPEMVLKPSWGHQGKDVYFIQRDAGAFKILPGIGKDYTADEISEFIFEKIKNDEYIAQPYINCRTKAGEPYDLRLHTQKGAEGEWLAPYIYPRISSSGGIVCNISQGACTEEIGVFMRREFAEHSYDANKHIEIFALQLAGHLDQIQRELYNEELDELGIDIGLDKNRRIYIYEVNWRPGHPPLPNIDLSIIRNKVKYAMYLAGKNTGGNQ